MAARESSAGSPASVVQQTHPPLSFAQIVCAWLGNRKSNNIPSEQFSPRSCVNKIDQKGRKAPTLRVNVLKHRSFVRLHIDASMVGDDDSSSDANSDSG